MTDDTTSIITEPVDPNNPLVDLAISLYLETGQNLDAVQLDAIMAAVEKQQAESLVRTTLTAAYLNGFIQESAKRVQAMIDMAITPDERRAILPSVEKLHAQIDEAAAKLEALNG